MFVLCLLLGQPALAQAPSPGDPADETCTTPTLVAREPDVAGAPDLAGGTWSRMARAPFGSEYEPLVWTGRRMVAVDSDSGRTAVYRPRTDRWREASRAPRPLDHGAPVVWTGSELIVVEISEDGSALGGLAYDPTTDRWRELAGHELEPDGVPDHVLVDALWTGSHVVAVDAQGPLVAHDPAADCWIELGAVPGEPWAWHLYQAGPSLFVESRRPDEPVEIRAFDPATDRWSPPSIGPLAREASEGGGVWVDGRLLYVTWLPGPEAAGTYDAVFDPVTMTWSDLEHDCTTRASGTIVAGGLLVASNGRRALDGRTFGCVHLPAPPRKLNGTERAIWTGDELIAWSGIRSLTEPPRRGGLVLRLPDRQ